jgi:hypothetical protein
VAARASSDMFIACSLCGVLMDAVAAFCAYIIELAAAWRCWTRRRRRRQRRDLLSNLNNSIQNRRRAVSLQALHLSFACQALSSLCRSYSRSVL